jgi:hypothetical protein
MKNGGGSRGGSGSWIFPMYASDAVVAVVPWWLLGASAGLAAEKFSRTFPYFN